MALNKTAIEWTEVFWNVWSGCRKILPGCGFCYAHTIAENKRGTLAFPNGFDLTYRPHKLEDAMRLKTPSLIFVNFMSDFFLADAEFNLEAGTINIRRDPVLDQMEQTPHQYQVLTSVWLKCCVTRTVASCLRTFGQRKRRCSAFCQPYRYSAAD